MLFAQHDLGKGKLLMEILYQIDKYLLQIASAATRKLKVMLLKVKSIGLGVAEW